MRQAAAVNLVGEDFERPGAEARVLAVAVEGCVGTEDGVLKNIGKVFVSPHHAPGVAFQLALDGLEQGE